MTWLVFSPRSFVLTSSKITAAAESEAAGETLPRLPKPLCVFRHELCHQQEAPAGQLTGR